MNMIRQGYQPKSTDKPIGEPPRTNKDVEKVETVEVKIKVDSSDLQRAIDKARELRMLLKLLKED